MVTGFFICSAAPNYNYSILNSSEAFNREIIDDMIYTKFPERIVYGLLRRYGKNISIEANIFVEESTEYRSRNLHEKLKEQLNIQSLYRGERFFVSNSWLVPKNTEIGIEMVDLVLGIIRTIIRNKNTDSKSNNSKNELSIQLLKNPNFYSLLKNIRCFEWSGSHELLEFNFADYLQLFLANHHSKYIE